jgi:SAM-dependent methyltransferase
MSFPWHDDAWRETAEFLAPRARAGERILAPDRFWVIVPRVERFVPENLVPDRTYDWVVLRLRDMARIPRGFLEHVTATMRPVFANRMFVVWTAQAGLEPDVDLREQLGPFWSRLARLGPEPSEPNKYVHDGALGATPTIRRLADASNAERRAAMDELHRTTGYQYPTLRDQAYRAEVEQLVASTLEGRPPGRVLELAGGGKPFPDLPEQLFLVRSELSEVGSTRAKEHDGARAGMTYAVMDAEHVCFASASFDVVLFVDGIEHVGDAAAVFREASRVLAPGGEFLVTFANRDSVNQVLTEKLGYPRFVTNHQHIREFTLDEIREMLDDADLEVLRTAGISLYPYWGVPGLDQKVRKITDDDAEFVGLMSELGRLVGAEHAYTGVVLAQKPTAA